MATTETTDSIGYQPQDFGVTAGSLYVCRCLQVTEAEIVTALDCHAIETLKELRNCTGAGEGCTACHRRLLAYIQEHQAAKRAAVPS